MAAALTLLQCELAGRISRILSRGEQLRTRRLLLRIVLYYAVASVTLAIALGELAFHPQRVPLTETESAKATAARFGADLQDVSISASDGTRLQAWFAHPANANGDAVILLHGVGDNRQGMMGFAELFLSKGYSVLLPDSRGQGLSDGTPSYGLNEANDVRNWFDWSQTHEHPRSVFGMGESIPLSSCNRLERLRSVRWWQSRPSPASDRLPISESDRYSTAASGSGSTRCALRSSWPFSTVG